MFVARALHWQPNAGTTINTQYLNVLRALMALKKGRWKATLSFEKLCSEVFHYLVKYVVYLPFLVIPVNYLLWK